jgi:cell division transport system permease protein
MASMLNLELDLPLADTPASRFLAWIAGGLVFLAVIAFALAAVANGTAVRLALEPRVVTVALPASGSRTAAPDAELARVLAALQPLDGVAFARPVEAQELGKLVAPWIGPGAELAALPMPRLVDVGFNRGREPDLRALKAQVAGMVPGATIDDGPETGGEPSGAARSVRALALGAGALVLAVLVGVVVVVTRMSLDLHQETVDLLRLMGAPDDYVARQFEHHALSNALRGGLFGFTAAIMAISGFVVATTALPAGGLPAVELRPLDWLLLGCIPVAAALSTAVVSRLTARRSLARVR